jgi:hypothetical protein
MLNLDAYFAEGHGLELNGKDTHVMIDRIDKGRRPVFYVQGDGPHNLHAGTPAHAVISAICLLDGIDKKTPKKMNWLSSISLDPTAFLHLGHRFQIRRSPWKSECDDFVQQYAYVGYDEYDKRFYVEHEGEKTKLFDDVNAALDAAKQCVRIDYLAPA